MAEKFRNRLEANQVYKSAIIFQHGKILWGFTLILEERDDFENINTPEPILN